MTEKTLTEKIEEARELLPEMPKKDLEGSHSGWDSHYWDYSLVDVALLETAKYKAIGVLWDIYDYDTRALHNASRTMFIELHYQKETGNLVKKEVARVVYHTEMQGWVNMDAAKAQNLALKKWGTEGIQITWGKTDGTPFETYRFKLGDKET